MYKFDHRTDPFIKDIKSNQWHHSFADNFTIFDTEEQYSITADLLDPNKTMEEKLEAQRKNREEFSWTGALYTEEEAAQVDIQEVYAPGLTENDPPVRLKIVTPKKMPRGKRPAFYHLFGGGLLTGGVEKELGDTIRWAVKMKAIAISCDYRLIPEFTYPCQINDAEAGLNYVLEHAAELNIDTKRLIVYGMSAGGYMASCLAQRLRMKKGFQFAGCMLISPVLDDYLDYPSSKLYVNAGWNSVDDQKIFAEIMGPDYNRAAVPPDGIPIHCEDFTRMPPTVIVTSDIDYGRDPLLRYAQGLMNADVFCDIHIWPGAPHGIAHFSAGTKLHERVWTEIFELFEDLLTGKLVRNIQ